MPDQTQQLVDELRRRIADPGAFLTRRFADGLPAEGLPTWRARAIHAGLEDGTLGYVPAAQLAEAERDNARLERRCDRLTSQRDNAQADRDRLTAELDEQLDLGAELLARLMAVSAIAERWTSRPGTPEHDCGVDIRQALQGGTAPVPGSSRRAQEPAASPDRDCVYLDVRHGQLTVTQTTGRTLALAVNGEFVAVPDRERTTIEMTSTVSPRPGWDPSSPQWAVIRAAIAWRSTLELIGKQHPVDAVMAASDAAAALIGAVDALPHAGEQVETPEQSAAIVDANLRGMGAQGLGDRVPAGESQASEPALTAQCQCGHPHAAHEGPGRPGRRCVLCFGCNAYVAELPAQDTAVPAAPKLAQGGIIRRDQAVIVGDQPDGCIVPAEQPARPARSTKFQSAIAGRPLDILGFTAGSGRYYEGERSHTCPGDNVPDHRHDILCIRPPSPPKPPRPDQRPFA